MLVEGVGLTALQSEILPIHRAAMAQPDTGQLPLTCRLQKQSGAMEHLILGFSTETVKSVPTVSGHRRRFCGVTSPLGNQPEKHQKLSQKWLSGEYVHLSPTWTGLECVT